MYIKTQDFGLILASVRSLEELSLKVGNTQLYVKVPGCVNNIVVACHDIAQSKMDVYFIEGPKGEGLTLQDIRNKFLDSYGEKPLEGKVLRVDHHGDSDRQLSSSDDSECELYRYHTSCVYTYLSVIS